MLRFGTVFTLLFILSFGMAAKKVSLPEPEKKSVLDDS